MNFKTADLCDEFADEIEVIGSTFHSFGKRKSFCGPICTVKVFEDNVLVKKSLESIEVGSVLVVDGGASMRCALLGDRLGEIAVSRGLSGVIINGCVRDCAELAALDIGIFALGSHPLKSKKEGKGQVQIPVKFMSVEWNPGDFVYCDEDGIVLSRRPLVNENA